MYLSTDTLSLPYTQGTDLSVQVVGWIKPSLPLPRRPLRVAILGRGGHQTQRCCWITLLVPRVRAAASGAQAIGNLEPWVNAVGTCHALRHTACNLLWVAAQVGYTSGWSCEGRKRVRRCWECEQAARSSLRSETRGENTTKFV